MRKLAATDWKAVEADLVEDGHAVLRGLLEPRACAEIAKLWTVESHFRKQIDMARHRYGQGEYRYFAYPLPTSIATLRERSTRRWRAIANRWQEVLRREVRFPATLPAFLAHCHAHGQERPTPLMLRYEAGGWNALHQDLYGEIAFPLQATALLSRPGVDFEGGEFLLVTQRPRAQSRGEAVALGLGDIVLFPNADRPGSGSRGPVRWSTRHGVSTIRQGHRLTLGLIFHDAK